MPRLSPLPTVVRSPALSREGVLELLQQHPLPPQNDKDNRFFAYGTAGFRQTADDDLKAVVVRTGIAAVLRSWQLSGQAMGVMITASHNDESYNGVKIADPHGGMLAPLGEQMAVYLANERDVNATWQFIVAQQDKQVYNNNNKNKVGNTSVRAVVHVGRDTRVHSPQLAHLLVAMVTALGGTVVNHGICTTPMLHHAVLHDNFVAHLPGVIPCRPNIGGYLDLLAWSYTALLSTRSTTTETPTLVVDCACGVGYIALQALCDSLVALGMSRSKIVATNGPGMGPLNEGCGSEFVQKEQKAPQWYEGTPFSTKYCAALDGDADRIVFFATPTTSTGSSSRGLKLLDGDKIACLFCQFIQEQIAAVEPFMDQNSKIRLGVVQTAYANGASTDVLRKLVGSENVLIAKTGVKHVHHAAHTFDIGVYFEANGHGTILFGPKFYQAVSMLEARVRGDHMAAVGLRRLQLLPALVNQAVGDALSDLLLVDTILTLQGRSLDDWGSIYVDLPSRQSKVMVPDRTVIKTNENETQCIKPAGLQEDLSRAMNAVHGRTFVRPSGTEDVVRVYAEGPTQEVADDLAKKAEQIVHRFTMPSKM